MVPTSRSIWRVPDATYQGYSCETLLLRSRRLAGIERDLAEYIAGLERAFPRDDTVRLIADALRDILGENDGNG